MSPKMPSVAPLTPAHAALIASMHHICFAESWDTNAMQQLLGMPGCFGWLACQPTPAGFILARIAADEAEILTLLVLPPFRRLGLARDLLEKTMEQARAAGATQLFLEVAADNQAALAVYRAAGFFDRGRRPHYYASGGDALIMARSL